MGDVMTAEYKKDFLINILYIATVLALIVIVSKYMMTYFFPFIIGVTVALAVQRPARGISAKFSIKKQLCAVILTLLICAAVLTAAGLFAWLLGSRLAGFISKIPVYFSAVQDSVNNFKRDVSGSINIAGKNSFESVFSTAAESFVSSITGILSSAAAALIGGLPTFLIGSIVTVVASCYIAKDFDRLKKFLLGIVPEDTAKKIVTVKNILVENTLKFIKGYGIIAAVTFLELSAALAVLGVKKAVLKAFLISLIDVLPVLGIGTAIIPWSAIEIINHNYYLGFGLLISYAVIVVVRNFIEPKIIGEQIGINPVFTLVSMFLGLKIAGITGLLLFPLSLTVTVEYYRKSI